MKTGQIYRKTMCFAWMKLGLGTITVVLSAIVLGICIAAGEYIGTNTSLGDIAGIIIAIGTGMVGIIVIYKAIYHYIGYLVKAGHVAVIAMALTEGKIPEHPYQTGKEIVKSRFLETNVFFVIDRLISGAVSQIQNVLSRLNNLTGNNTIVNAIVAVVQIFISIVLEYVDECCLAYIFYKKDENPFKCAADGVVIYFKNWKNLLKNALWLTLFVIVATLLACIIPVGALYLLFDSLGFEVWVAVILGVMIAFVIKVAFIDSYMLIKVMQNYMLTAPTTEITFDLYEELCKMSKKFTKLFKKSGITAQKSGIK